MSTIYPGSIDGYSNIKVLRDRIDAIVASDHNDLRSAVIAIEQTLGTNPQGIFGTVVARLNDAYNNITIHTSGLPPRHSDDHIDSPARSGTKYDLAEGTVATQIEELLADLNDAVVYDGSSPVAFADGYSLPSSSIDNAITQIIKQLGDNSIDGTTKVHAAAATGSPNSLSAGDLRTQLTDLLQYINDFSLSTGADSVGAAPFNSTTHGTYPFTGSTIQDQVEEAGHFLDENAVFIERAFDTFVVEGLAVSRYLSTNYAQVTAGYLAGNGRLLRYAGATDVLVSAGDGTYYVYAKNVNGVVTVASTTSVITATDSVYVPTVLLAKIDINSGVWTVTDIRRYGMLTNNKNCFTVGDASFAGTNDGYGFDFMSISAAVEHIKILSTGSKKPPCWKIVLGSNISVGSAITLSYVSGLEIDGNGRIVYVTSDVELFVIESSGITIKNVIMNCQVNGASNVCLAHIGSSYDISDVRIENCKTYSNLGTSYYPPYFVRFGNASVSRTNTSCFIYKNAAAITKSAIDILGTTSVTAPDALSRSIISNNYFSYPTSWTTTIATDCIQVGNYCSIDDNIIFGPFNYGINVKHGQSCVISNNFINGGTGYKNVAGTPYMGIGIAFVTSVTVAGNIRSVVSGNVIKGFTTYGIDCYVDKEADMVSIVGNILDNRWDFVATATGIRASGLDTFIANNTIYYPGAYAVTRATSVINNIIIGNDANVAMVGGIYCSGSSKAIVIDNLITACSGFGINAGSFTNSMISNNIIYGLGDPLSTVAIYAIGNATAVCGNNIVYYTTGIYNSSSADDLIISSNKIINYTGVYAINMSGGESCVVNGNIIKTVDGESAIIEVGSFNLITANIIKGAGTASHWGIVTQSSGYSTSIDGNYIYDMMCDPTGGAIKFGSGTISGNITNNIIRNCPGTGININNVTYSVCSNNVLIGNGTTSENGIYEIGSYSVIDGNSILYYCATNTSSSIDTAFNASDLTITNNFINLCNGYGIYISGNTSSNGRHLVANNHMFGGANAAIGINNVGKNSIVANNNIIEYGSVASTYGIRGGTLHGNILFVANNILLPNANMLSGIEIGGDYIILANNMLGSAVGAGSGMPKTGINANGKSYLTIIGNIVFGCDSGTASDDAIKDVGDYCDINSNKIIHSNYVGISTHSSYGKYCIISSNSIHVPKNSGIHLKGTASLYSVVNGNAIYANVAGFGIDVDGNYCQVIGNYSYNSGGGGIGGDGTYCQATGNFIKSANGVLIDLNSTGPVIMNNFCIGVGTFNGIACGKFAIVSNNYITNVLNGIVVSTGIINTSINGNVVYHWHNIAYYFDGAANMTIVGNSAFYPHGEDVTAMSLGSCANVLVVGNFCEAAGGGYGFDIGSADAVAAGNLALYGTDPGSWGTSYVVDTNNCIYIAAV